MRIAPIAASTALHDPNHKLVPLAASPFPKRRQWPALPPASPGGRFAEAYVNNRCILGEVGDVYLNLGSNCTPGPSLSLQIELANNTIYAPPGAGTASVLCGGATVGFDEWVASGSEPGTTLADVPPTAQIIAWARELLSIAS